MELIRKLNGMGYIRLDSGPPDEVHYEIDIWSNFGKAVFGRGRISGEVEVIFRAALVKGSIPLALADNRLIEFEVTSRGAGNDWADIYVRDPAV